MSRVVLRAPRGRAMTAPEASDGSIGAPLISTQAWARRGPCPRGATPPADYHVGGGRAGGYREQASKAGTAPCEGAGR
jgi:hypothetical protein